MPVDMRGIGPKSVRTVTSLLELATNAINLGHWAALCPQDPRASRSSAKSSLAMVQED